MLEEEKCLQFKQLSTDNEIVHLFTKKPFDFNRKLVSEEQMQTEFEEIEKLLNYKFLRIERPIQTHSNIVKVVTKDNADDKFNCVDGLITNLRQVALTTVTADCQAILLYDPVNKVIGNIHSGWRGTLNKIVENAIELMKDEFKCDSKNIMAFICPSILKCCFEIGKDVVDMFKDNFENIDQYIYKGEVKEREQKYYIDTVSINIKMMKQLGLLEENIYYSNICTKCNSNIYHSYREEHDKCGRNIALICLK